LTRSLGCSALALLLLVGCGGGASPASVSVAPESRTVLVGDPLPLTASGTDLASDLEWEVAEPFGGGLRNSQGMSTVYFAPEAAGTFHLVLRAVLADGRKLKQTVEIRVLPILKVEPASAQVAQGGAVTFTATLKGLARQMLKWSVDESDGGEIDQDGHYLAPSRPGTYHVTAASANDPLASARATVTVI